MTFAGCPPFAIYDIESCCWTTVAAPYSETWPKAGLMRRGQAFACASGPCTNACSWLLPTPTGSKAGNTSRSGDRISELLLGGIAQAYARGELVNA
jgi:hypothetical protein